MVFSPDFSHQQYEPTNAQLTQLGVPANPQVSSGFGLGFHSTWWQEPDGQGSTGAADVGVVVVAVETPQ